MQTLCGEIDSRRVGSAGNRAATDFFARAVRSWGFAVETPEFPCIDWADEGASLTVAGTAFAVRASPYSLGCDVSGVLATAATLEELERVDARGAVLLVRGELAKEQLMPKNFTFYNPDEHKRIVALLEARAPQAIVAATGRDPGMAGALYPFPLIEDGDFDIPSVYMTDVEGERLAAHTGQPVSLHSRATRAAAVARNVTARKGDRARRLVFFAHIDAKSGTPGAIDNASGVAILLLLAEALASYAGDPGVEITALNGEDYYSAPGEMQWLAANAGRMHDIVLGVNLDGVGYRGNQTAFSLYGCPPALADGVRRLLASRAGMVEGPAWYQSDHSLFMFNGVPALAFTSADFAAIWSDIAHTERDTPEIVDPAMLVAVAAALHELVVLASGEILR
jgi:aminopeptidase YwaD